MLHALKNRISTKCSLKVFTLLFCVVLIATLGIGTTLSTISTKTPTLFNTFLNGLNPDGDLVIQKTVSHPFGDAYQIPEDLSFTFEVDLGDEYAQETVKTSQGELIADENGVVTVTVSANGRTTIYDIDEKTIVTVTETQIGKGFTPDTSSYELTIQKYQNNCVVLNNTYRPESADSSLLTVSGKKVLTGRDWMEGDSFTFGLEVYENGVWKELGTETITYELVEKADSENPGNTVLVPKDGFDEFDFTDVIRSYDFAQASTYSFRIVEKEGTIGGITYDEMESHFDILVGDADMDGSLEIQSVTSASSNTVVDGTDITVSFENKYAPEGSAKTSIEIQKVMDDTSGQEKSPAGYTFELFDESGKLLKTSDQTDALGETSFQVVYDAADVGKTYTYSVKETNNGQIIDGLKYDDEVYKIQVSVVDKMDGTVSAYVYDWKASAEDLDIPVGATDTYKMTFTNVYNPQDASVEIEGSKILLGRDMEAGEFSFDLYQTDALFSVVDNVDGLFNIADAAQPVDTVVNDADGNFHMDSLTFEQVGTYYYVVAEDASGELGGVTYDSTCYLVTIVVSDNKGVLKAETTITDQYGEEKEIAFTNIYKAAPVSLHLEGTKIFKNAELKGRDFNFLIYTADEEFNISEVPFETVGNNETGKFVFSDLVFTTEGTYRYVAMEDIPDEDSDAFSEDVDYDDTVYHILVEVTDSGDGQLVIDKFEITSDGQVVEDIVFENTYVGTTGPVDPDLPDEPINPDTPDEPTDDTDKPDRPFGNGDSPLTGDISSYSGLLGILGVCVVIVIVSVALLKKNKTAK